MAIDNKLPVAREGLPFILIPLALAFGAIPAGFWLVLPFLAFGLFSIWFFRDPERQPPQAEAAVVSPADGTVIKVEDVFEDRFLQAKVRKISIFMSLVNVHVNRAPFSGRVAKVEYSAGKFLAADKDKAPLENENNAIVLDIPGRDRILFVQIAGLIARRIACWIEPDDDVKRGQRIGLIRFGSRLDVYLPPETEITVGLKDKVRAGESILGLLPSPGGNTS